MTARIDRAVGMIDGTTVTDRDAFLAALTGKRLRKHRPARRRIGHRPGRAVRRVPTPLRPRPKDVDTVHQVLPAHFAATLHKLRKNRDPRLSTVLRIAAETGWTFEALAAPLGITREGVRQRALTATGSRCAITIPQPPFRVATRKIKPLKPTVAEPVIRTLQALREQARGLSGMTPAEAPERRAAERLAAELAALVDQDGIPLATVARALRTTRASIYLRLARFGYRALPPSARSTVYRGAPPARARQAKCDRGHPLSGDNLRITKPGGVRVCRACERIRTAKYQAKQQERQATTPSTERRAAA